jgi:hypothetical protein
MVEAWDQSTSDLSHAETAKRKRFLHRRYKSDLSGTRRKRIRCSRERAHHVDDHHHAGGFPRAVHTFDDASNQCFRSCRSLPDLRSTFGVYPRCAFSGS